MQATAPTQDAERLEKMCCSAGAMRHKSIVVACMGLVVLLTAASTVDLTSLITVECSLDKKTFQFLPTPKPPELKPNQQRVNDDYSNVYMGSEGLFPFKEGFWGNESKYGWVDQQGNVVIKARKLVSIRDFHRGLARVKVATPEGERWGFIGKRGEFVIPARFMDVTDFNADGLAIETMSSSDGSTGHSFIDTSGKSIVNLPHTKKVEFLSKGVYTVEDEQTAKVGLVDANGKDLLPRIYTKISSHSTEHSPRYYKYSPCFEGGQPWRNDSGNWFLIEDGNKKGAVDAQGNVLVKPLYEEVHSINDGVALVKKDQDNIFINAAGETVVPGKFNQATAYADLIAVSDSEGNHIIDKTGKRLKTSYKFVEPDEYTEWFKEGLAPVADSKGRYAYINKLGKTVIEPKFEAAFPFYDGRALVYDGKFWMFIDKKGNDVSKLKIVRVDFKNTQNNLDSESYSVIAAGPLYEIFKAAKTREEMHSTIDGWKRSAGYSEDVLK